VPFPAGSTPHQLAAAAATTNGDGSDVVIIPTVSLQNNSQQQLQSSSSSSSVSPRLSPEPLQLRTSVGGSFVFPGESLVSPVDYAKVRWWWSFTGGTFSSLLFLSCRLLL
jgi:hypothetical protein